MFNYYLHRKKVESLEEKELEKIKEDSEKEIRKSIILVLLLAIRKK